MCDRDLSPMVSGSTFKQYRVRFSGSPNCGPAGCATPTLAAAVSGKYLALSFQTLENPSLYKVDYQKSLGTSNWLSLTPWLALPSGVQIQMFDEIVDPSRFYRL